MLSARMINVLCLALVLTVTFLMSPAAVLAAPASENVKTAVESEAGAKCVDPGDNDGSFEFFSAEPGEASLDGLYRDRDRHHPNRCERVRHKCLEQCRHHRGHHDNHRHCFERCMRYHDCHHYR
ncbi:hypothetical protein [Anaeroselena agilis]|uniref:Uncharacterized protein n=1 Tax=Anaeroselena agilis TaxID=3063788 RepID=A0ABU3P1F6_9FIRM|nr:hypothetical protein [Selenomonadales bacterium 4137-cl]